MPRATPEVFADIALHLEDTDPDLTAEGVLEYVCACIPNDGATLLTLHGRRLDVEAATNDLAREAAGLQTRLGEGPSLDVAHRPEAHLVEDVETDGRWPAWSGPALELGIRSVLSVRVRTLAGTVGALDLCSRTPGAFDDDDAAVACVFADHAAVALAAARTEIGLRRAIDARHIIGQAQGILMERFDLDAERAFAVLRRYSQARNVRLREVAETLVEARTLPGEKGARPPRR